MSIPSSSWPAESGARAKRLADALSPNSFSLLRMVAEEAARRGLPLYLVGGFVRDLLLGRPATDFDLVVEGDATALARALAARHGGDTILHNRFGTAQWFLPDTISPTGHSSLDLISARSETYKHPAALPTVRPGSLADDLRRRDFTINTLALRLDGEYFGELRDDLGGLDDLQKGLVRVLHPRSFEDDPTRLFRLVRYEIRYGFKVAPETLALLPESLPLIKKLSTERLRHELDLILEEDNAAAMLKQLAELKILAEVHPALTVDLSIRRRVEKAGQVPPRERGAFGWMLWLIHLPRRALREIESRLHFHANLRDALFAASTLYSNRDSFIGKKPSQYVAVLDDFPLDSIRAVFLAAPRGEARRNLHNYMETWRHVKPKTTGHTLKKLGLEPGPRYQKILRLLRDAWLDGEVTSEEEEKYLLEKLV